MNITERFTLFMKGSVNAVLDSIEDPERSLNQLILDMEDELESAKRAAARAIANEDRMRAKIDYLRGDAAGWQDSARRSLEERDEASARDCLRRAEKADRQRESLQSQLESQARDTVEIREQVGRLSERVAHARSRLQLLQARMRQGEARRAINQVMTNVDSRSLYSEFARVSDRLETEAASERAYQRIDDELSGEELRRRVERTMVEKGVEERLEKLKQNVSSGEARS